MSKREASDQSSTSSSSACSFSSSSAASVVVDANASLDIKEKRLKFVDEIHSHLVCPITHELMIDPVLAEDGNTYERSAIQQWIRLKGTSPLDPGQRLRIGKLPINRSVLATTTSLIESGGCDAALANSWRDAKKKADLVLAEKLYAEGRILEAAKLGLPKAQSHMASRYGKGIDGVDKDPDQCFFWAKKAADGGDTMGQHYLGWAYNNGFGTAKDASEALKWYELAASSPDNSGYGGSCNNIGLIYKQGGAGVACDHTAAATWLLKGAEAGISVSQHQLAQLYENGLGVPKDLDAARRWYQKSATQKHPEAMYQLGKMLMHGLGGSHDIKSGMALIFESSELGNEKAKETVGKIVAAVPE